MADTPKQTVGQLGSSEANIYTPAGSAAATVVSILFYATATPNTVAVYIKVGATDLQVKTISLTSANPQYEWKIPITLANTDAIRASATNASQVNYAVSSFEHT